MRGKAVCYRTPGPNSQFIRVDLARPVPREGRGRVLIDKTYQDAASYYADGDTITFSRTLGVKRNAVALPSSALP